MQAKSSEQNSPEQANSLAGRIRLLLTVFRLQQKELAQVMGVEVDRVKSLVLERAKALRRSEIDHLKASLAGVTEDWLVDGIGAPPDGTGAVLRSQSVATRPSVFLRTIERQRELMGPVAGLLHLGNAMGPDATLLIECVQAAEAELQARGRQLESAKRLRLYWAVFELSLQAGHVNAKSIGPLIDLAAA